MSSEPNEPDHNEESNPSRDREPSSEEGAQSEEADLLISSLIMYSSSLFSSISDVKYRILDSGHLKFLPSGFFFMLLVVFLLSYGPVLLEDPDSITPNEEKHYATWSIGEGDHNGNIYQLEKPDDADFYREEFIVECTPEGDYLSTGESFNCEYDAMSIDMNEDTELVEFDRDLLNRIGGEPLILAKWERLSPEGEIVYVAHRYGYSADPTLSGTFEAYTPTEPGEYEFSLLLSTHLNPIGPEHPEERVVPSSTSNMYVYSEEQAASFTISEATYRLEQVAIIGIALGLIQLILSTYPAQRR